MLRPVKPPQLRPPRISAAEIERRRQNFLVGVQCVAARPVAPVERKAPHAVDDTPRALLVKCALEPTSTLMEIYGALKINPEAGKRAVDDLVARGQARLQQLPRTGRGNSPTVVEVLPAADDLLASMGLRRPPQKVKGSWRHNLLTLLGAQWVEKHGGQSVRFEHTLGDKTFDFTFQSSSGLLVGAEICMTGSAERTAQQLVTALSNAGVHVLALFETRAALTSTQKHVRKLADAAAWARLQMLLLGEIIQDVKKGE